MILYVDGPAVVRNPLIAKVARSIMVAHRNHIHAYAYNMSVRPTNAEEMREYTDGTERSHHANVVAHASMTHPVSRRFIVLTDATFTRNAGPRTGNPSRWMWISTGVHETTYCESSGIWTPCEWEFERTAAMFERVREHLRERVV